jgi:16S rRNA (guanine966-N2)-methyltransferase
VREALFGILTSAGAIEGARVLDLYAGSGALGLDALSRGALRATRVEVERSALAAVRANVAALGLEGSTQLLAIDVTRGARRIAQAGPFDLVLADPPWALVGGGEAPRAVGDILAAGAFAESAWVVLEHAKRTPPPDINGLLRRETRDYGDTALTFYKPAILGPPRPDQPAGPPSD